MTKFFGRISLTVILVLSLFFVSACSDEKPELNASTSNLASRGSRSSVSFTNEYKKDDTWLVYWYLCGTDLESDGGGATLDLSELVDVQLPPNVKVLIQTGGTLEWQNEVVQSDQVTRFLYDNEDLKILQTLPDADMGSKSTLIDFLRYGKDNFKADHSVFVFWDHGGGSIYGICVDERTGNSLSLNDLTEAFSSVYSASPENPPFEIIGFDACLMATYETARSIYGFCNYMVGSEEVEPGNGWNYTGWVGGLANNPAMGGASLGKLICDTYMQGCKEYETDDTATLSVIDMSKVPYLNVAYEYFGLEALKYARRDFKTFFSLYGRGAQRAENYGGNTRQSGYFDMVDLSDLAKQSKNIIPSTYQDLIDAVDEAVIYKVQGDYRSKGSGISGFYSYDGDEDSLKGYLNLEAAPFSQKMLYYYLIYGELPDNALKALDDGSFERKLAEASENIEKPDVSTTPPPSEPQQGELLAPIVGGGIPGTPLSENIPLERRDVFSVEELEDLPVDIDNDGNAFVTLTDDQMDILSAVHCQLLYISESDDILLYLGSDSDIDGDWDTGIFKDNFRGVWPTLDGHWVYMEIVSEGDDYNLYNVPIVLNGVACNLLVTYDYNDEEYHIIGARRGMDPYSNMSDRELIKLKAGDEITTIHYATLLSSEDDDLTEIEMDTFTISSSNPRFEDTDMGDGVFGYCFEFVSPTDDSALSQIVTFTVVGDTITTSVD